MSDIECPICKSQAIEYPKTFDGKKLNCTKCGEFSITGTALATWKNKELSLRQIANASGWIREHQGIFIGSDDIEFLSSVKTPSVAERAEKILQAVSKQNIDLSDRFDINSDSDIDFWLSTSYSYNPIEIDYLFKTYLRDSLDYLSFFPSNFADGRYSFTDIHITPRGYAYLDSLSNSSATSQIGFCAMWFDASVLPIWTGAIEPAIKSAGYDPKRIDGHQHNNRIDDEIIAMLRRSKFVVADFTGQRGGVYFEAGFALGLGLQVIWTCKKSELEENKIHFDARQYNFVTWQDDKLDEFKSALQNRIEATIGRGTLN